MSSSRRPEPSRPGPAGPRERGPLASYHRALAFLDGGDEVAARRAVEEGLARSWTPQCAPVRECLDDLGAQLDGDAALRRFAARTPGPRGWIARPGALADEVMGLGRAHLMEIAIEEVAMLLPDPVMGRLIDGLRVAGGVACDDLLVACGTVLGGRLACHARAAAGGARASSPAARALAYPRLAAAWSTPVDATSRQQQVIIAVARDGGRVAPLLCLIDDRDSGPVLRDGFFLPDMVPGRLDREVLAPMAAAGMRAGPSGAADALERVYTALHAALSAGGRIPSEAHQSVITRMRRLYAACGGSCTDPSAGSGPHVG
ncbi:MAG: hypothetical protein FJW78_05390 [Actinobacteria bacterium]|nr:hypothetical protein [Actinomycetota bacterium]